MGVPGKPATGWKVKCPSGGFIKEGKQSQHIPVQLKCQVCSLRAGARETDKGPIPEHTGWKGMLNGDKEVLDNDRSWQMRRGPCWREVQRLCLLHQVLRQGRAPSGSNTGNYSRLLQTASGQESGGSGSQLWLMNRQQVCVNKRASSSLMPNSWRTHHVQ